ncbi:helix-turn-helix transcriptional regulator [Tropicibacter sp. R15_0]|uniref:helix-turn-helix transcriptional regulator n=1 Tax=Tropicibacter sp. R15_0 TaxID=2821101 RepID=UPI00256FB8D0|nr:helix-turn-helix transcriptional regulator [Tropicibacter sp. R15_0]
MMLRSPTTLWVLLVFQGACTGFFVYDAVLDARQGAAMDGPIAQMLENMIAGALVVGTVITGLSLRHVLGRQKRLEQQLDLASGAFEQVLQEHFDDWGLTPSERDVARLAIKGLSIAEMADLRGSKEGTIKAQSAAVYRKAGVSGRLQLLSLFIEELMAEPIIAGRSGGT